MKNVTAFYILIQVFYYTAEISRGTDKREQNG